MTSSPEPASMVTLSLLLNSIGSKASTVIRPPLAMVWLAL